MKMAIEPKYRRSDRSLEPSAFVVRSTKELLESTRGAPILDLACGSGRNALWLAQHGCTVVCLDKDLDRLRATQAQLRRGSSTASRFLSRILPIRLDLLLDPWPFRPRAFGAIVNVHFLSLALLPWIENSLQPGGLLLLETIPGHGCNYLELPSSGQLKRSLCDAFDVRLYRERRVGPRGCDAVVVKLLAWRR